MRDPVLNFIEETFTPEEGHLLEAPAQPNDHTGSESPRFQFNDFFDSVIDKKLCPHPEHDGWYCVPIHKNEAPTLTNKYVVFINHQLRGKRVVLADPTDSEQYTNISPDEFSDFTIVNQLRFWTPSCFTAGTEQARSFATTTIANVDPTETTETVDDSLVQLQSAVQGLRYALVVNCDLPSVERATIERQQETLAEYIEQLRATKRQAEIQTIADKINQYIQDGDEKLDDSKYEEARSIYLNGQQQLDDFRHNGSNAVAQSDQIKTLSKQLSERIQTAQIKEQKNTIENLQKTAAATEQRAKETEANGDYLQARALYKEARQTYKKAQNVATQLPELRDKIQTALDRTTGRIEAAESDYYHTEISGALEQARRNERLGDQLAAMEMQEDAITEYEQAMAHATTATTLATEGGVLESKTASYKETLEEKHTDVASARDRQRVEQLVSHATTLEQNTTRDDNETVRNDTFEEIQTVLHEARALASATDGVDTTPIEQQLNDIKTRYQRHRKEQNEAAVASEVSAAEDQYEAGEQLLEAGEPLDALQSFRDAKHQYVTLRNSLSDRGLDELDLRIKARISQLEQKLHNVQQVCQNQLQSRLETAEQGVEDAKRQRDTGDYEAAQVTLREALHAYQAAHQIASELDTNRVQDIRSKFRSAESEILSLQAVPAKTEIQHCIENARNNVQAGFTAQQRGSPTNAHELYNDAQYFIEEAIDIINEYEFGTTEEIERLNLNTLLRNKRQLAAARRDITQATDETELPARPEISNVTEHLHPPNTTADEIDTIADAPPDTSDVVSPGESESRTETETLDILDNILSEFNDGSDL